MNKSLSIFALKTMWFPTHRDLKTWR